MMVIGCLLTLMAMAELSTINSSTGEGDLFWPLILRGFGGVMMFIPLSMATLGPLPKSEVASASGFFSLTRQLGGSLGIAAITTLVEKMQFVHRSQLVYGVSDMNPEYAQRLADGTALLQQYSSDSVQVHQQSLTLIDQALNVQAALLSYRDVFYFVGGIFVFTLPLILILRTSSPPPPTPAPVSPPTPVPAPGSAPALTDSPPSETIEPDFEEEESLDAVH
jgi:DHA2 family multidrug resistance protein